MGFMLGVGLGCLVVFSCFVGIIVEGEVFMVFYLSSDLFIVCKFNF